MKKEFKFLAVGLSAFALGMSINSFALSGVPANYKVAVVDVQKVVSQSKQVNALNNEQQVKMKSLITFIETARKNVAKEKDPKKKKALEDKYNKELDAKKSAIEKEYVTKLKNIDANISNVISAQAKTGSYNLVLAKGVVLFGGEDITDAVAKAVK